MGAKTEIDIADRRPVSLNRYALKARIRNTPIAKSANSDMSDSDLSIKRIMQVAISEACETISNKIGRVLTEHESAAIATIIDTEHFWARAEEIQMFVKHNDAKDVLEMVTSIGTRYRELGKAAFAPAKQTPRIRHCGMCSGSGECYCIRKGSGTALGCPRCAGDGKCRHCRGSGAI